MVANVTPIFTLTPVCAVGQASVANTARDGTGTLATVKAAATDGTKIDSIMVIATGTTTAGMVRIFIDTGGTIRLLYEFPVAAITPSASVACYTDEWIPTKPIVLVSGQTLKASTHNAETFNIWARGGDF